TSLHLERTFSLSDASILSLTLSSSIVLFMLKQYDSRAFLAEILSRCCSSSDRYFSASLTILSMSSFDKRPLSLVIVILFSLPVDFSIAETFNMPVRRNTQKSSISKVTSICGTPRGAGGIPVSSNLPRMLLSFVIALSPSEYVVNVWVCFVGIVVFLLIKVVITPPAVSIPNDNGVTSSRSRSWTSSDLSPNLEVASEFLVSWWSHRLKKNDKRFLSCHLRTHYCDAKAVKNISVKKLKLTENGVAGVHSNLILRRITDQPLGVGEGYVAWRGPITLVIGDDLNFPMLEDTHARVRGAQVDSDCRCFRHR
ncbi:NAD-specific glutamate dehydrogenase, partial [Cyphomyrmex costatus]